MSDACEDPEIEQRIERYLEGVHSAAAPDLEALARELPDEPARRCLRAGALAGALLALRADGRAVEQGAYLARLTHADERARFERIVRDAETARAVLPGELVPGCRLDGRYEILREVGQGGMGAVYAATDHELEREVAIKVLRLPPGSDMAREWETLFQKESRTLARLASPNIVTIHDARRGAEHSYIVMDLVRGRDLFQILRAAAEARAQGAFAPASPEPLRRAIGRAHGGERADLVGERTHARAAARILHAIALTVERAHAAGVIHRDLKPQNVMLVPGGEPVLLDFGLASWGHEGDEAGFRGTPEYMAPEQVRELRAGNDTRTDVYQLGLLLYECLALTRAFPRKSGETLFALFERITQGDCRALEEVVPGVPRALAAIARRAMASAAAARYVSVKELREDLDRFLAGLPPRHAEVPAGLAAGLWATHLARRPATLVVLALGAAAFFWLRPEPWVPPELVVFQRDSETRELDERAAIEFRNTCVLGLSARVESPTWLYVFSLFGPTREEAYVRPAATIPLEEYAAGNAVSGPRELAPGTHELACTRLANPDPYEGLLVFASAEENELLARWQTLLEDGEAARGVPATYTEALGELENLRESLRGEPLGTLTPVERERIFGAVQAAERGDEPAARAAGLRKYHFLFPVERLGPAR
jgi:tRNA A-37 threonylcarbamoyl transferase component Bud32